MEFSLTSEKNLKGSLGSSTLCFLTCPTESDTCVSKRACRGPPEETVGLLVSGVDSGEAAQCSLHFRGAVVVVLPLSCVELFCDPMDCSTPGFSVLHYLPEFAETRVHGVGDAVQPSYLLSSLSCLALTLSQHQGLFQ